MVYIKLVTFFMYSFVQDRFSHIGVEEFICTCSEDRDNNGVSKTGLNLLFPVIVFEWLFFLSTKRHFLMKSFISRIVTVIKWYQIWKVMFSGSIGSVIW